MIDEKFINLVKKHLKYLDKDKEFSIDESLKNLGLDSLESIHLLIDIEDIYNITMSDEHLTDNTFSTVSSLWKEVEMIKKSNVYSK